jgi:5-carboxymethyl-2-hydroxymuconate isomerase
MAHLIVEYSANLDGRMDVQAVLVALHAAAAATGVFPVGGLRTRAARREHYCIADRHPDNAFVHVSARIGHGRSLEVRKSAASAIFEALRAALADVYARTPLGLSLEMQEIDPELSFKHNNLHEYVAARARTDA